MGGPRAQLSLTRGAAHLSDPRLVFAEKTTAALWENELTTAKQDKKSQNTELKLLRWW